MSILAGGWCGNVAAMLDWNYQVGVIPRNPVTVPTTRRETDPKTLDSILRQAGMNLREFADAAEEVL